MIGEKNIKSFENLENKNIYNYNNNNILFDIDYIKDILDILDYPELEHSNRIYKIKIFITQILHNHKNFYIGCPNENCKKKLSEENIIKKQCEFCKINFKEPQCYYTLNIRIKDCTYEYWVDIFGKCAEELFGIIALEYKNALNENNYYILDKIRDKVEFTEYFFYIKPKIQKFGNGMEKKKLYVNKIEKINFLYEAIKNANKFLKILGINQ